MKRLTKNDLKKMVLMGIASGTMLATQANAASPNNNNGVDNTDPTKKNQSKLANDCRTIASKCGGHTGCNGSTAYRTAPQQGQPQYQGQQQYQQGQQPRQGQQDPQVYTQWETSGGYQYGAYRPSSSCSAQAQQPQTAYRQQQQSPSSSCGGQTAYRTNTTNPTDPTNARNYNDANKTMRNNNPMTPAQAPAPQAPIQR